MLDLQIKKLTETAISPKRNHETDLGMDLYADGDQIIQPGRGLIKTGIAVQADIKDGIIPLFEKEFLLGAFIRGCSGNFVKKGLHVVEGTLDKDYQGELGIMVSNNTNEPIEIEHGKKVAQLVFVISPKISDIKEVQEFETKTKRGEKGFGESSGTI